MQPLDLEELEREATGFDAAAWASADIDRFCSSSEWVLPASRALMPPRPTWIRRGAGGYVALARTFTDEGVPVLEPLEAAWALAAPIVGADPFALAEELAAALAADRALATAPPDVLLLAGLVPDSPRWRALVHALAPRYELRAGPTVVRYAADLAGGVDGWLARRSANFRRSLRRSIADARDAGLTFHARADVTGRDEALALFDRALAVEARSWKSREGVGILDSPMIPFYRDMLPRLAARGGLRVGFLVDGDGRDVAYIVGARRAGHYRGLQFSYDASHPLTGLGNVAQYEQIVRLVDEGVVSYDLGSEVDYKRRWADPSLETAALIAIPRR